MRPQHSLVRVMGACLVFGSSALAACISDSDGDGVCDNVDLCPGTVPGALVESNGCPVVIPGDADRDGDVDFADFVVLTGCQPGPDMAVDAECQSGEFDYDFDADVDLADFAGFQRCFSGENQPGSPDCASHRAYIAGDCLHVIGTATDTVLALGLLPGWPMVLQIDVENDGTVDFAFDRNQFTCIVIIAGSGNDVVWIDEQYGVFTDTETTTIYGGTGDDTLLGGSGPETYAGGPGNDDVYAGAGDDLVEWHSGDDTDFIEGGEGIDNVQVNGGDDAETLTITANGTRVRFDRINPAPFFLDIGTCESLVLRANGGNDSVSCTGNLAALIQITAEGGSGEDTLLGSNGIDVLLGGDDNDFVDGNQGNDVVFLGSGEDVFQWDPGDGSDTVEGQDGVDGLVFNGSGANEAIGLSANGARLRLVRDVGSIVLDLDDVEQVTVNALGGADTITVNELTGTAVVAVSADLATFGGVGDGQADTVSVVGTPGADVFNIAADGGFVVVDLAADVRVKGYETGDQLVVNGVGSDVVNVHGSAGPDTMTVTANGTQARVDVTGYSAAVAVSGALSLAIRGSDGPDTISCTGNLSGLAIPIALEGGSGEDTLLGSNGIDVLLGGDDNDFVDGNQGNDVVFLGSGEDVFQWDPGDGSDTVEGQDGVDGLVFNGSGANEAIGLSANGARLRLVRDVGSIVLDLDDVEQVTVNALGGADTITVNELTGTAVVAVSADLATFGGVGDGQADTVTVDGTGSADTINIIANSGAVELSGLVAFVRITHSEANNDTLIVNGLGGVDTITTGPDLATLVMLIINQ